MGAPASKKPCFEEMCSLQMRSEELGDEGGNVNGEVSEHKL